MSDKLISFVSNSPQKINFVFTIESENGYNANERLYQWLEDELVSKHILNKEVGDITIKLCDTVFDENKLWTKIDAIVISTIILYMLYIWGLWML